MSVAQALNHVQSWLNAGEYDKVIQGCQEVLQIEPGNARALSLMRQAEERRHNEVMGHSPEASVPVEPTQEEESPTDPLASLQVEKKPEEPSRYEPEVFLPEEDDGSEGIEKRKLFLAMLIPAVVVVLLGGAAVWWMANRDREETIEDNLTDEEEVEDIGYLEQNDQRVEDMEKMIKVLEEYKRENGAYPSLSQVEAAFAESDDFEKIPSDPRQGEIDKAGQAFGYIYAIYDGIGGENSVYVLSALFEDSSGFGTPWAQGATIKNYPDYRDYEEENVTFIGGDEDEIEEAGKGLKDEEDEEEDTGPKVNPNN